MDIIFDLSHFLIQSRRYCQARRPFLGSGWLWQQERMRRALKGVHLGFTSCGSRPQWPIGSSGEDRSHAGKQRLGISADVWAQHSVTGVQWTQRPPSPASLPPPTAGRRHINPLMSWPHGTSVTGGASLHLLPQFGIFSLSKEDVGQGKWQL